jgi:hypothetical protein
MKKQCSFFWLVLCLTSLPLAAAEEESMGWWMEASVNSTRSGSSTSFLALYERPIVGAVGFYFLASADSTRYRHYYGGVNYKVTDSLKMGIGIGRENQPFSIQKNIYAELSTDTVYGYATYERGGSGSWHKAHITYKVLPVLGLGIMGQTGLGNGGRLEYSLTDKVQLAVAVLTKRGDTSAHVAVSSSF